VYVRIIAIASIISVTLSHQKRVIRLICNKKYDVKRKTVNIQPRYISHPAVPRRPSAPPTIAQRTSGEQDGEGEDDSLVGCMRGDVVWAAIAVVLLCSVTIA